MLKIQDQAHVQLTLFLLIFLEELETETRNFTIFSMLQILATLGRWSPNNIWSYQEGCCPWYEINEG